MKSGHLQYASNQCRANMHHLLPTTLFFDRISMCRASELIFLSFHLFFSFIYLHNEFAVIDFSVQDFCQLVLELLPYSLIIFFLFQQNSMRLYNSIQVPDFNCELHKRNLNSIFNGFLLSIFVNWQHIGCIQIAIQYLHVLCYRSLVLVKK